jgi:hypothetical protein
MLCSFNKLLVRINKLDVYQTLNMYSFLLVKYGIKKTYTTEFSILYYFYLIIIKNLH